MANGSIGSKCRKLLRPSVYSMLLLLVVLTSTATIALAYLYRAPYTVTNNSTTGYTMLPVFTSVNSTYLVANGFMKATALDSRVETIGGLAKPHMVANDRVLTAVAVPASSQTNLYLTTGNSDLAAMNIITGYGGNITVADNPALELGNNFTVSTPGYLDTTAGVAKDMLTKSGAISWSVSPTVSGMLIGTLNGGSGLTQTLYPDGVGDATGITSVFGAVTHWGAQLTNDGDVSYVYVTGAMGGYVNDTYAAQDGTIPAGSTITSVIVHALARCTGVGAAAGIETVVRLGGVSVTSPAHSPLTNAYADYSDSLARPGGGAWTSADIANLQIGVSAINTAVGEETRITQVYVVITYTAPDMTVHLYNIASGYKSALSLSANGTAITMVSGTSSNTTTQHSGMVDNGNPYCISHNNVMPYADSFSISIDGISIISYRPVTMISGTTMPNSASGGLYPGTIAWGIIPTGVTVTLGGLVSSAQPVPGTVDTTPTTDLLPETSGSDWHTAPDIGIKLATHPLRPFVQMVADNTTLSERQAWVWSGIAFVLFVLLTVATRVKGHHLITGVAVSAAIIALVVQTIFPWWTLIVVALAIVLGLISERSPNI